MSELMLHGILNAPCDIGDPVGVHQLKCAARRASVEITTLTKTLRIKELENQQLAQDKAELAEALKIATDTLSLFTDDSIDISKRVSSKSIESPCLIDDLLEKHK